jgi:hypothetical protein
MPRTIFLPKIDGSKKPATEGHCSSSDCSCRNKGSGNESGKLAVEKFAADRPNHKRVNQGPKTIVAIVELKFWHFQRLVTKLKFAVFDI